MQGVVWVASFRVGVGLLALLALPMRYASLAPYRPLFGAYVVWSSILVLLVWQRMGGELRPLVGGLVDQLILSFLIHEVGSTTTMLSAMYMLSGTMNALVVSFRVGVTLAIFGSALFAGMIAGEQLGWLDYAPAAPDWLRLHPPTPSQAFAAAVLAAGVLILSTLIVGRLVRKLRVREAELLAKNAQLEELSQRDALTQLYNRRHVFARIEAELARVNRGQVLSVLMIDLDGFKRVNDQRGHLSGDTLLREVAAALLATIRTTDVAGRFGGDEFVVLLPDTGREAAFAAAERVAAALAEVGRRFDAGTPITASIGVAVAQPGDSVADVLHRADHSSYGAKRGGGNQVVLAEAG